MFYVVEDSSDKLRLFPPDTLVHEMFVYSHVCSDTVVSFV